MLGNPRVHGVPVPHLHAERDLEVTNLSFLQCLFPQFIWKFKNVLGKPHEACFPSNATVYTINLSK